MAKVLVLGEVIPFRRIVVSALRSRGVEASDADVGREGLTALDGLEPDVIVLHLQSGVLDEAYFHRFSVAAAGKRIVVVEEHGPLRWRLRAPAGVDFLSRREVAELVDAVRRTLAG